jgi:hypothetical protein
MRGAQQAAMARDVHRMNKFFVFSRNFRIGQFRPPCPAPEKTAKYPLFSANLGHFPQKTGVLGKIRLLIK